jgi:hypothetical protein
MPRIDDEEPRAAAERIEGKNPGGLSSSACSLSNSWVSRASGPLREQWSQLRNPRRSPIALTGRKPPEAGETGHSVAELARPFFAPWSPLPWAAALPWSAARASRPQAALTGSPSLSGERRTRR